MPKVDFGLSASKTDDFEAESGSMVNLESWFDWWHQVIIQLPAPV